MLIPHTPDSALQGIYNSHNCVETQEITHLIYDIQNGRNREGGRGKAREGERNSKRVRAKYRVYDGRTVCKVK